MAESAFSIRLFQLGVKLILKKTQMAGSNENFIKLHTKTIREGVTNSIRVIEPKKILILQLVMTIGRGVRRPDQLTRSWFYYTTFMSPVPKLFKWSFLAMEVYGRLVLFNGNSENEDAANYSVNDVYPTVIQNVKKFSRIVSL